MCTHLLNCLHTSSQIAKVFTTDNGINHSKNNDKQELMTTKLMMTKLKMPAENLYRHFYEKYF